ncbi:hypothetical protein Tco_1356789 [Tanacetum coccineum]
MAGDSTSSVEQVSRENGVAVSSMDRGVRESDNEGLNGRLAFLIDQEIMEDRARLDVYWNLASQLTESVRRKSEYIDELKGRRSGENADNLRFLERMRLEDMEKGTRCLLMLKETEMKMKEKGIFVSKLKDNVAV